MMLHSEKLTWPLKRSITEETSYLGGFSREVLTNWYEGFKHTYRTASPVGSEVYYSRQYRRVLIFSARKLRSAVMCSIWKAALHSRRFQKAK
ncbi:hypothetical protein AAES_147513 [Amazona aestiva]|uniref:Uncharacterized protein n=1 Tax=Amazona aestiva TaxID=12930 RepID=A0A0Q3LXT2_AMAAE|nr:hypothetical protein AAES_147513 [Amazona aestiva]